MKKEIILSIFLYIQLFFSCTAPKTIYLKSNPSGAGVWTNRGKYVGSTPCIYRDKIIPDYFLFKEWGYDYKKVATEHNVTSYYAVLDKEVQKKPSSTYSTQLNTYAGSSYESDLKKAKDCIAKEEYSTALSIMNNVLLTHKGLNEYYYRAIANYGIGRYYEALQDCNSALSYANSSYNNNTVYYLRGVCHFQLNNESAAINDMKKAGDMGDTFLKNYGSTQIKSSSSNSQKLHGKSPSKNNRATKIIPELKKTK